MIFAAHRRDRKAPFFSPEALLNSRKSRKNILAMSDMQHVSGGENGEK